MAAPGPWLLTNTGRTKLVNGTFDLDSDSWKCGLATSASNLGAASTTYAGLTGEVANGNGYTTGGIAVTLTLAGTNPVTVDWSVDPVWTASGAGITARYAFVYEVGGDILAYCLLDSAPADVAVTAPNTLTINPPVQGILQIA